MRAIGNLIGFIVVMAILIVLLRAFGWDPIELFQWAASFTWSLIDHLATWIEESALGDWLREHVVP
ncbi:hypothetical protein [Nesterenkonia alba]|uniref:hypothetical protein n=1 Tax=Nesterenkonia alba TaxID=515814 RepID=UPI0003B3D2C1|nr:hypothetical protein [Nesterenkonia alba]